MTNLKMLDYQFDFVTANEPNVALLAGVGCGKTLALAYFVIRMVSEFPKSKGMICANVYSQLINSTLNPLFSVLDELNIPYKKNISGKVITILNTEIYVYSLEKYDTIRGVEVGWIICDELFYQKSKMAYDTIKTRLRCKNGPLYFRCCSTKNGYNWGYDMYSSPSKDNNFRIIESQTKENIFLPQQYMDDLLIDYGSIDNPMYRQEILNEYVNLTAGSVYWSFDREKHVKECFMENNKHVYIGADFNIDNMSAVMLQIQGDELHVCKELSLKELNSNTFVLADRLSEELYKFPFRSIIADSTGKARKTSSAKSDHQILKDKGFVLESTRNPRIRDRQNTVNKQFTINKLIIDPSCVNLIKEIETLSSRDDEGKVVHISVALGYIINFLRPIKAKRQSTSYQF